MAYDDVIERLGQFGRYQRRIFLLLCLPAIVAALHKLSGVFLQARVSHRCRLPMEADNASYWSLEESFWKLAYPPEGSSCQIYKANFTSLATGDSPPANSTITLPCPDGWLYDTSNYKSTTLTETVVLTEDCEESERPGVAGELDELASLSLLSTGVCVASTAGCFSVLTITIDDCHAKESRRHVMVSPRLIFRGALSLDEYYRTFLRCLTKEGLNLDLPLNDSKAWLRATSDAALMVGVMLGSIIFGDLSDRLGRKPIFFLSLVLQVLFGVLVALSPSYYFFMVARMIVGATTSGTYLVAYVISMEMVGPKKRMLAGVVFQSFFSIGFLLCAAFAFYIREWRTLQLALTLPGIAFFSYWWFIPESVRWQLTKGRWEEAKASLRSVAKENKKNLPESLLEDLCKEIETEKKKESSSTVKPSLLDLFKYSNLRRKSLIIFFLWFVNAGTYYGLSWNTSGLGGNEYVSFVISGAVEIPAYGLLLLTLDRLGRKAVVCGAMIVAGIALIISSFISPELLWLKITLAMTGKLAITASYGTVYILTAEQFPTVIRNVGLGAASTFARVGGILAPYVNIMAEIWTPLPLIVFGVMALVSGFSALVLPETLNKKLPDSIEDGENFGKKPVDDENKNAEELRQLNTDKT